MIRSPETSRFPDPSQPLQVIQVQVYRGPNAFSHGRLVRLRLHEASLLPFRSEAVLQVMDALYGCDGLTEVRTLPESRQVSQLVALLACQLQKLALGDLPELNLRKHPGKIADNDVLYPCQNEQVGRLAGWLALQLIEVALPECCQGLQGHAGLLSDEWTVDDPPAMHFWSAVVWLKKQARKTQLGPTTAALVKEAQARGIPVLRLDDYSLVQLGYGKFQQRIRASITSLTSSLAVEAACDKDLTKSLLQKTGIPVPEGKVVRSLEGALKVAHELGYPLVTKPLDGNHGRGVTLDVSSDETLEWGFEQARLHSEEVILEQQFRGRDYRILVVGGKLVAAAERVPAHVVGDGVHTIEELMERVNRDPRRGEGHEKVLTRLTMDDLVVHHLARAGFAPVSVPAESEVVFLRETANLSTGGTAIDRTDEVHPENRRMFERAARSVGLDVAGLDVIAPDISKPIRKTGGGIIEVNACPGFRMHLEPSEGTPRNVAAPVMDLLFPADQPFQLPIASITGTNGKTTTSRMLSHILKQQGYTVGLTTSTGIYVDGMLIEEGDTTGPISARTILMDPEVDFAVLETARGGMMRTGLAFEECHIGAVLNVQEDHLGLKGIDTLEDLAWVKSVVIETVAPSGFSILNADDPLVLRMKAQAGGQVMLFSMQGANAPAVQEHLKQGGTAVVFEHLRTVGPETASQAQKSPGWITLYQGSQGTPVMPVNEIPATLMGLARVNIENALAAVSMAHAAGVPSATIREALQTFGCSFEESPGRLNFYREHPFTVLMDYAHNPAGITHLKNLVLAMKEQYGRVIGVVGAAGDRRNQDILKMGALCAEMFDQMILRDDEDTRGREEGESAALLLQGALQTGMSPTCIQTVLRENEAVETAMTLAEPGDLVVVIATEVEEVWEKIKAFSPALQEVSNA
ncbi:cyanophycin synthetase [Deinococcus cellulosilyticus]|uniref:Cyanophycin synthetase n=1 Tax=Deinococcus cellulosilyticus (strain DSM 18568 / NBRC 106333 / KACC 11606 / 5516J-15) TaxID=1223518 RepID=A0A511N4S0_DEIC1|nr:cyanophycin synthetase [Deinococcus cellulosilyticus]GEM47863.1 cyanophycin synthetase [Deinococcus cellulosilyticus NBRC 106333 = KACC 11606]